MGILNEVLPLVKSLLSNLPPGSEWVIAPCLFMVVAVFVFRFASSALVKAIRKIISLFDMNIKIRTKKKPKAKK